MNNKFTIYGNPVKHSKSPQMHNAGFETLGFDAIYTKTLLEDGSLIKKHFLSNNISGANITVPYKEVAFEVADEVVGIGKEIGAVNTYINKNGKIIAYNTDADGFMMAIDDFGNIKNILIIGAGGTAKALAVILKKRGYDTTVVNRSQNKLEFFTSIGCASFNWQNFKPSRYDLVVNCTSAGLKDNNYPMPIDMLKAIFDKSKFAYDCIYGKTTPFLSQAQQQNLIYKDGEDMLLFQGVLAFELFTNTKANDQLIEAMRDGLSGNTKL